MVFWQPGLSQPVARIVEMNNTSDRRQAGWSVTGFVVLAFLVFCQAAFASQRLASGLLAKAEQQGEVRVIVTLKTPDGALGEATAAQP